MGDTTRCKRGMVFWIDDKNNQDKNENVINVNYGREVKEIKSHVMAGTRPWLVISCDESNTNSPICNVIPITSTREDDYVYHVPFFHNNIRYTALIEQIKTVDSISLSGYLYTLDEKTIEKIELSMLSQFGIHQRLSCTEETLIEVVNLIEPTIKKVMLDKANISSKVITSSNIEDIAIKISQNIEELFATYPEPKKLEPIKPKVIEKPEEFIEPEETLPDAFEPNQEPEWQQEEVHPEPMNEQQAPERIITTNQPTQFKQPTDKTAKKQTASKKEKIKSEKKKNGQRKWTYEMKLEFLSDCEKMSIPDIMRKWDMPTKGSYYTFKYQIKKEITEMEQIKKDKAV